MAYTLTATQMTDIYALMQEYYQEKGEPQYREKSLTQMMRFLKKAIVLPVEGEHLQKYKINQTVDNEIITKKTTAFNLKKAQEKDPIFEKNQHENYLANNLLNAKGIEKGIKISEAFLNQEWFYLNDLVIKESVQLKYWPLGTDSEFQNRLLEHDSNLTELFRKVSLNNIHPFVAENLLPIYMEELINHRCLKSSIGNNMMLMTSIAHTHNGIKNPILAQEYLSFLASVVLSQNPSLEMSKKVLNMMESFLEKSNHERIGQTYIDCARAYEEKYKRSSTKFYNMFINDCASLDLSLITLPKLIMSELMTNNEEDINAQVRVGTTYRINMRLLALQNKVAIQQVNQTLANLIYFYENNNHNETPHFLLIKTKGREQGHIFQMDVLFENDHQKENFEKDFKIFYNYINENNFLIDIKFEDIANTLRLKAKMETSLMKTTERKKHKI